MKKSFFRESFLSLVTFTLLLSGCGGEVSETDTSVDANQESVQDIAQNIESGTVVDDATSLIEQTTKDTTQDVEEIVVSEARKALDRKYDEKLVDCYTSENENCSAIIDEMVDAQMELEMQESIEQEEKKMEQEMMADMPTQEKVTVVQTEQGVSYAQ